jgi:hypothetical protein
MKIFIKLNLAILALNYQYLAFVLNNLLLVVVYFYEHHQLSLSIALFALDFFMLVQLNEL